MDKGIKLSLLGIGVILLGIAMNMHVVTVVLGVIGFGVVAAGCFWKDKNEK